MSAAPEPGFAPVSYVLPQKRLLRLSRTGMRRSYGRYFWFTWIWLAVYLCALAVPIFYPEPFAKAARELGRTIGWRADSVTTFAFALLIAIFVLGLLVRRRFFRREVGQRVNFENRVELSPLVDGLSINATTIEHRLRWSGIHQLLIEPDGLALAHGGLFFFVPSDAFASNEQYRNFVGHVIANLTPEATARSQKDIERAQTK